jgi:hypothetical protein
MFGTGQDVLTAIEVFKLAAGFALMLDTDGAARCRWMRSHVDNKVNSRASTSSSQRDTDVQIHGSVPL